MNNNDVRTLLKIKHIPMWKIAEKIGISEPTITRWFREPLTEEHYSKVMDAVQAIEEERTVNHEQNKKSV